jgi:hypothetical protein
LQRPRPWQDPGPARRIRTNVLNRYAVIHVRDTRREEDVGDLALWPVADRLLAHLRGEYPPTPHTVSVECSLVRIMALAAKARIGSHAKAYTTAPLNGGALRLSMAAPYGTPRLPLGGRDWQVFGTGEELATIDALLACRSDAVLPLAFMVADGGGPVPVRRAEKSGTGTSQRHTRFGSRPRAPPALLKSGERWLSRGARSCRGCRGSPPPAPPRSCPSAGPPRRSSWVIVSNTSPAIAIASGRDWRSCSCRRWNTSVYSSRRVSRTWMCAMVGMALWLCPTSVYSTCASIQRGSTVCAFLCLRKKACGLGFS